MFTLRNVLTISCSARPLGGESPMKRMMAIQNTQPGHMHTHVGTYVLQSTEIHVLINLNLLAEVMSVLFKWSHITKIKIFFFFEIKASRQCWDLRVLSWVEVQLEDKEVGGEMRKGYIFLFLFMQHIAATTVFIFLLYIYWVWWWN